MPSLSRVRAGRCFSSVKRKKALERKAHVIWFAKSSARSHDKRGREIASASEDEVGFRGGGNVLRGDVGGAEESTASFKVWAVREISHDWSPSLSLLSPRYLESLRCSGNWPPGRFCRLVEKEHSARVSVVLKIPGCFPTHLPMKPLHKRRQIYHRLPHFLDLTSRPKLFVQDLYINLASAER